MCILFSFPPSKTMFLKIGYILKNLKRYMFEHIFLPAPTTRKKNGESFIFVSFKIKMLNFSHKSPPYLISHQSSTNQKPPSRNPL